jgi:hypothetical protein
MPSTVDPGTRGGYFEPLRRATYLQLTTFRRSGQPVPTPVHVVTDGAIAYFRTWDASGKAKRLRHTDPGAPPEAGLGHPAVPARSAARGPMTAGRFRRLPPPAA